MATKTGLSGAISAIALLAKINRFLPVKELLLLVFRFHWCWWAVLLCCPSPVSAEEKKIHPGAAIYQEQCVSCHGENGEGVDEEYDEPLYGDRSVESLAKLIERTMPEDQEDDCVGEDARKVADYIFHAFYSPAARNRAAPARISLTRLTAKQYRASVADVFARFLGNAPDPAPESRGLKGQYFPSRNFRKADRDDKKKGVPEQPNEIFKRTDSQIRFAFGESSPDSEKLPAHEFSIRWDGSVVAEESGLYEFRLRTENGAMLWVNDSEEALIDAWVSSGTEPRDVSGTVYLLAGRAYPLRLDYFKFKEKSASVELWWKPPHGVAALIPAEALRPERVRETMVVSTPFPAEDSSEGYERGSLVSADWDAASTRAAIEAANYASDHLRRLSGKKSDSKAARGLLRRFVGAAFRRPLTESEVRRYVDSHFEDREPGDAVKRGVLLALKSPWFLYPGLGKNPDGDHAIAARLALGLWDSIPDEPLMKAADAGELRNPASVEAHAQRMLNDVRTRVKLRGFFHHWLHMDDERDLRKDKKQFPEFDEAVIADLRTSLNRFVDRVVWHGDSDFRELLLGNYLMLNGRLAGIYGVSRIGRTDEFLPQTMPPDRYSGVLTHPYLLASLSYHDNTSPIHRGVFLTRNVIGRVLKPPPMATAFVNEKFDPTMTMREKVETLTGDKSCMVCHVSINPLGFSLENFDAIGRWRETETNGRPVDSESDFKTDNGDVVYLTGPRTVAQYAAMNPDSHRAFITHLFHHTAKQPIGAYPAGTLDGLHSEFVRSDYNIRSLLEKIVVIVGETGPESQRVALVE